VRWERDLTAIENNSSLQDDALQLANLDRRVTRDVLEQNTKDLAIALEAYQELRKRLKERLVDSDVSIVQDAEAADILRKMYANNLQADKIIERVSLHLAENERITEFDDEELWQLGKEFFYSWFSHHEYISGLAELRPILLSNPVAQSVARLVRQIKDCYAFQQYDAAYGLCRTLIEASVRDICVRRNLFPDLTANVVLFEKRSWRDLREKVSVGPLAEHLKGLYDKLSSLLHARKIVTRKEARDVFEETLEVIEQLYATHGL